MEALGSRCKGASDLDLHTTGSIQVEYIYVQIYAHTIMYVKEMLQTQQTELHTDVPFKSLDHRDTPPFELCPYCWSFFFFLFPLMLPCLTQSIQNFELQ